MRINLHSLIMDIVGAKKMFDFLKKKKTDSDIEYLNLSTLALTEEQLKQCADLFSENYGRYSARSDRRPGEAVKMGVKYYRENYVRNGYSVALALCENKILGQAFYIRNKYDEKIMTWIVQLVVDKRMRQRGVASTLLRSIWGFSDDYAWGLATANPCTVRTLESATMRKCKPSIIKEHVKEIYKIGSEIGFVEEGSIEVNSTSSQINTHFDVDNSEFSGKEEYENRLGVLKPGREWLAFTFQNQGIKEEIYEKAFPKLIAFSEKQLKDAYDRMPIEDQKWAKGTEREVGYILNKLSGEHIDSVVDIGCGVGRHSLEFSRRGLNVLGVDFSNRHISRAKEMAKNENISNCDFICEDIRKFESKEKYDLSVCLYDVIGSFPNPEDNQDIVNKAYSLLNDGGFFVISVMNMELTESIVPNSQKGDVMRDSSLLLRLKPSSIMQHTGDIFNPSFIVIDEKSGIVYRKEQFSDDEKLPAEYVIRDKRYRMKEIVDILEKSGFSVLEKRYVQAGKFETSLHALDKHAKEIFVIAKKI